MPDYDLGRAHGSVEITADTDQAQRALGEYERATKGATKATSDLQRVEQERTRRAGEVESAARRRKDAESEYKRVMSDTTSTVEEQIRVERERNKARGEHLQATRRAADAERAYNAAVSGNTDAVRKFIRAIDDVGPAHDRASKQVRDFRREVTDTERTVRVLSNSITSILGPALKGLAIAGGIGILGGAGGLLGAGGLQGLTTLIGGAVELIKDFSGALLLLPGIVAGTVTVMGVLAIAFHGVSDALSAAMANDPKKFAEAIKDMGPATQSVIKELASFTQSFKGAMAAVQDSFFRPLIGIVTPLVQQWLPALQSAGQQVASVLGEAGKSIAQWLSQTSTMQSFQEFIQNISQALQRMLPAIQPVLDAFIKLTTVGTSFFPQIADTIVKIANAFNDWVQGAAASGQLQSWIQRALDSFDSLWEIIKNVGGALSNIANLSGQGGFLDWLVKITAQFKAWTDSTEGAKTISAFFTALSQAGQVLAPILGIIGGALAQVAVDLTTLGTNMGPGLTIFFQSLSQALGVLGQALVASGPALNQVLITLGQALLQVVTAIGPQLPGLFQDLASVLVDLAPVVGTLASAMADFLSHLTPTEIEIILGLVVALQALTTVIPIIVGAMTGLAAIAGVVGVGLGTMAAIIAAVIVVVAALVVGIVLLVTHWQEVKAWVARVWEDLKGFAAWLGSEFMERIHAIGQWFTDVWKNIREGFANIISEAIQWGANLIKKFVEGLVNSIPGLRQTIDFIAGIVPDFLKTGSPAKTGPLHDNPPDVMGKKLVDNYASGMSSGSSSVGGAAGSVSGAAAGGLGGGTASSENFGGGKSGFQEAVASLVADLSAFSSIMKNAFGLFSKIADIVVQTMKVSASLWNQGDNPMTRPGGVFGQPLTPQQQVAGVAPADQHGVAPMPEITAQGSQPPGNTPVVPQQNVPGVTPAPSGPAAPGVPPTGAPPVNPPASTNVPPPSPGIPPPTGPPAPGTAGIPAGPSAVPNAQAAGTAGRVGVARGASPDKVAQGIVEEGRRRGLTDAQIEAAGMIASDESNFGTPGFNSSGGNASVGGVGGTFQQSSQAGWGDPNQILDPGYSISKFYDIYAENLRRFPGIDPIDAAILTQNPQLVTQYGIAPGDLAGGSQYGRQTAEAWGGSRGGQGVFQRGLTAAGPRPAGSVGTPTPPRPGLADVHGTAGYGPGLNIPGGGGPGAQAERRGNRPPFQSTPYGLAHGTNTGGYGNPEANKIFPQWVLDLGAQYGVKPSTYPSHQESDRGGEAGYAPNPLGLNRGIDWVGSPQQMEAFAQALLTYGTGEGGAGGLEQIIYQAQGGRQFGLGGAGNDVSGHYYPQTGEGSYAEHATSASGQGGHVHTRFNASVPPTLTGAPVPGQGPVPVTIQTPTGAPLFGPGAQGPPGQEPPPGSPLFGPAAGGPAAPPLPAGAPLIGPAGQGPILPGAPGQPPTIGAAAGVTAVPQPGAPGTPAAQPQGPAAQTPMATFQGTMAGVSSIAGDAMAVFDNIIKSISATANIMDMLVRGPSSSEDIMKLIDNWQQYLVTAASVAKLVGSIGSMVGSASGGMDMGAGGAMSAIAGIVQAAIEATNMAIDLGQEVWHQVSKYAAIGIGHMLGGENGFLSGDVRMLLNTATGDIQAYSEDNPQLKTTHHMPDWMARSYGGTRPETQPPRLAQVNIYAGTGQSPSDMMNESMWLASNSGSSASIAAAD